MFFEKQNIEQQAKYELLLRIVASLSKLSAESSTIPYLYYRMAENIFCRSFVAKNLSRSDISIDASTTQYGIGLKTFLHKNSHCMEKVAEFNKERNLYINSFTKPEDLIRKISELRNNRIISTCGICSISTNNLIYHCVTRANSVLHIHEEPINLISIDNIKLLSKKKDNIISFTDGIEEYSFNISKSTLFKRFNVEPIHTISVKIFDDPFELLERFLSVDFKEDTSNKIVDTIYLPLYSYDKKSHEKYVPQKSGLNQWNAGGRKRKPNEVYIQIPAEIRHHKPDFFPTRDKSFTLHLPNGSFKMAKVCQDDAKALMSNPNEDLGKWLLRDVLSLTENELVTYEKLENIGIDTVQLNKFEDETYEINFKGLGTYETYKQQENIE